MNEHETPGRAVVLRRLCDQHEAVLARLDVGALAAAYRDHANLYDLAPDPLGWVMMRQFLGAACLYLSSRPIDENTAWTLNTAVPPMNLFVTGSSAERRVTGRVFTEDIKTFSSSRFYVDVRRSQGPDRRSVIDVEGLDVLDVFDQFSARSDQAAARFFELDDEDFLMIASLPTDRRDWIASLERDSARAAWDAGRELDQREFWFQCGCTRERVVEVVAAAWADEKDDLFGDRAALDVTCPRCGRRWPITPADFEGDD